MTARPIVLGLLALALAADAAARVGQDRRRDAPLSLRNFRQCHSILNPASPVHVVAPCAGRNPGAFVGRYRKTVEETLGPAQWCNAIDPVALQSRNCYSATRLVYGFYVRPRHLPGGGPELHFTLDRNERVLSVRWSGTE